MKAILRKGMAVFAAVLGAISVVFTSCEGETGTNQREEETNQDAVVGKFVKSITVNKYNDKYVISFEYNSQGQLTYVSDSYYGADYTYQYYTDMIVVSFGEDFQLKYYLEDGKVVKSETDDGVHFIDYDNNGYVSNVRNEWRNVAYTYSGGNMVKAEQDGYGVVAAYSDCSNKANICFNGVLSPDWPLDINDDIDDMVFIPWIKTSGTYSKNLCINYKTFGFDEDYIVDEDVLYVFDEDGYITRFSKGNAVYEIVYYE